MAIKIVALVCLFVIAHGAPRVKRQYPGLQTGLNQANAGTNSFQSGGPYGGIDVQNTNANAISSGTQHGHGGLQNQNSQASAGTSSLQTGGLHGGTRVQNSYANANTNQQQSGIFPYIPHYGHGGYGYDGYGLGPYGIPIY